MPLQRLFMRKPLPTTWQVTNKLLLSHMSAAMVFQVDLLRERPETPRPTAHERPLAHMSAPMMRQIIAVLVDFRTSGPVACESVASVNTAVFLQVVLLSVCFAAARPVAYECTLEISRVNTAMPF